MSMLSATELAAVRTEISDVFLPDTCNIERVSVVNSSGVWSESWATQVSGAACRFDPMRRQDSAGAVGEREAYKTRYQVTLEWDVGIQHGDRLIFNSDTYEILELYNKHSNRVSTRVVVARVD